ncbi:MAG: hypothetical protein NZ761_02080, partial [Dehalococcoidia bacterium]|nr:hypothetical protein [Dehalococcoidia bacterium]
MDRRRFVLALVGGALTATGCRRSNAGDGTMQSGQQADPYGSSTGAAQGQTPVTAPGTYELIPVWEKHQVPKYPGSQPGELSPLATQVENGGTVSFAVPDPVDQVLAFYR